MKIRQTSFFTIGIIYTISSILVKGINFIITPVFTRLMTQQEFGQYCSMVSLIDIFSTIVTLDLYASVTLAKYDYNDKINEYLSSILLFGNLVTIVFCSIVELHIHEIAYFLSFDPQYIRISYAYFVFLPAYQLLLAKYRIYNEYVHVIKITFATVLVTVVAQLLAVYIMQDKLIGRFIGNFAFVSIINAVLWLLIVIKGRKFSFVYIQHALFLAVPLIPHVLAGVLLNSSDRIMINMICGSSEAALYSLAYTIGSIANVLLVSINQAWVPWLYDRLELRREDIKNASMILINLFTFICCFFMLLAPDIILIFGGSKYYEARFVIAPVITSVMFQFVYMQYVNIEFYCKKTIWISIATIASSIINIGLNYVLLPIYGYVVAAYTTVIGFLFMMVLHYVVVKTKTRYIELCNTKHMFFSLCLVCTNMVLALISYTNSDFRFTLIFLYVLLIGFILKNKPDYIKQFFMLLKR